MTEPLHTATLTQTADGSAKALLQKYLKSHPSARWVGDGTALRVDAERARGQALAAAVRRSGRR